MVLNRNHLRCQNNTQLCTFHIGFYLHWRILQKQNKKKRDLVTERKKIAMIFFYSVILWFGVKLRKIRKFMNGKEFRAGEYECKNLLAKHIICFAIIFYTVFFWGKQTKYGNVKCWLKFNWMTSNIPHELENEFENQSDTFLVRIFPYICMIQQE